MNSLIFIKIAWSITLWLHICGLKNCKKSFKKSFKNFNLRLPKIPLPPYKILNGIKLFNSFWALRMSTVHARPQYCPIIWPTFLWRTFELFERVKIWSAGAWLLFCSINGVDLWSDFRSEFQLLVSFYIE